LLGRALTECEAMSGILLADDRQELFAGRLGPAVEMDCHNLASQSAMAAITIFTKPER
jgi:hypothetical protein